MASSSANRAPTANRGGSSSIATPANSGGSGLFGGGSVGASHGTADDAKKPASPTEYKRASQDGGPMYGNMTSLKRNSTDAGRSARKSSLSDQRPAPGFIGQMWNNFTQGTGDGNNRK